MPAITPNQGRQFAGEKVYKTDNLELLLYTGPTSPTSATVYGDITEVSGFGYSRATLAAGSWTVNADGTVSFAQQSFTPSGGEWTGVRGYAIVTTEGTPRILHIEQGPGAPYTVADGQPFLVTPNSVVTD